MINAAKLKELVALLERAEDCAEAFKQAIEIAANENHVEKAVMRRFVKSCAKDKVYKLQIETQQMSLLLYLDSWRQELERKEALAELTGVDFPN